MSEVHLVWPDMFPRYINVALAKNAKQEARLVKIAQFYAKATVVALGRQGQSVARLPEDLMTRQTQTSKTCHGDNNMRKPCERRVHLTRSPFEKSYPAAWPERLRQLQRHAIEQAETSKARNSSLHRRSPAVVCAQSSSKPYNGRNRTTLSSSSGSSVNIFSSTLSVETRSPMSAAVCCSATFGVYEAQAGGESVVCSPEVFATKKLCDHVLLQL